MGIDFSAFLDLSSPPKTKVKQPQIEKVPLDRSKFKTKKSGGIKFNYEIGAIGENSALTEVRVIKETYFNPEDYKVECGDLSLYCAAMFGGPLY